MTNFTEIRPVGAELLCAGSRKRDMTKSTKPTIAPLKFSKAPNDKNVVTANIGSGGTSLQAVRRHSCKQASRYGDGRVRTRSRNGYAELCGSVVWHSCPLFRVSRFQILDQKPVIVTVTFFQSSPANCRSVVSWNSDADASSHIRIKSSLEVILMEPFDVLHSQLELTYCWRTVGVPLILKAVTCTRVNLRKISC
jgi:hypothetical protein